jgi:hypothetical protein
MKIHLVAMMKQHQVAEKIRRFKSKDFQLHFYNKQILLANATYKKLKCKII